MKIGILTFHLPTNFGANIQALASCRFFTTLGHEVKVLNYVRPADQGNPMGTGDKQFKAHREFANNCLPITRQVFSSSELQELVKEQGIELIIVGADAVWRQPVDDNLFFAEWVFKDPELAHIPVVSMSAAHMGEGFKKLSESQRKAIGDSLRQFRYITVRDEWTRYVLNRDLFDGQPFVERTNPDPVFTLSLEDEKWDSLGQHEKGYVAVTLPKNWTLGRKQGIINRIWFDRLKRQVHKRGMQIVELPLPEGPSGMPFDFTVPYPIDPIQWFLWLKNAKYFIGMRFHAVVSCCASGTPFYSLDSYSLNGVNEKSKIYNLLRGTEFEKCRVLTNSITKVAPHKIFRLLESIEPDKVLQFRDCKRQLFEQNMKQMFAIVDGSSRRIETLKDDCTSCFACYNVCPVKAINIVEDAEGYYAPRVDYDKCIGCGKCDKTCPKLNEHELETTKKTWYGYMNDDNERKSSSSGGIFGALAERVLQRKGVVYGAAFNYGEDVLRLECRSTDEVDLNALKKSKYVQSYVGDAYNRVRNDLEQGREVLFCGTPCQVDGLKQSFGKKHEGLLTVDFVCHGVPSMPLLRAHLKMLGFNKPTLIDFRPKLKSWVDAIIVKNESSQCEYVNSCGNDAYYDLFLKCKSMHRSCERCSYCNGKRAADVTLADFYGYKGYDASIYDPKGLSLVLANTNKGIAAMSTLGENCMIKEIDNKYGEYAYTRIRNGENGYYDKTARNAFFAEVQLYGYAKTVQMMGLQKPPQGIIKKTIEKTKRRIKKIIKR